MRLEIRFSAWTIQQPEIRGEKDQPRSSFRANAKAASDSAIPLVFAGRVFFSVSRRARTASEVFGKVERLIVDKTE